MKKKRKKIGNKFTWSREYLLKIIDNREPIISRDWIGYYRDLPQPLRGQHYEYALGVDLAISEKDSADYTAIVSCMIIGSGDEKRIYILPNPINERMQIPQTIEKIKIIAKSFGRYSTSIYVEEVMLQGYLTQLLRESCFRAEGLQIHGMDKRARLEMAATWIFNKWILFPEKGADQLIDQLLNFGVTKHNDLVDAFTVLILKIIEKNDQQTSFMVVKRIGINNRGITGMIPRRKTRKDLADFIDKETKELFANHGRGLGFNNEF